MEQFLLQLFSLHLCDTSCKAIALLDMQILCYAMQHCNRLNNLCNLQWYRSISFVLLDVRISVTSSLPEVIFLSAFSESKLYCTCATCTIALQVAESQCYTVQRLQKCWQSLQKIEQNSTSGNSCNVNTCCLA